MLKKKVSSGKKRHKESSSSASPPGLWCAEQQGGLCHTCQLCHRRHVCPQGCGGHGCPHGCPTRVRLGWPQAGSHVQCLVRTSLQLGSCGHRGFSENAPSVWPQVLGVPFFPAPSNPGSVAFCSAHAVQSMVRMKGNVPGLSCARLKG